MVGFSHSLTRSVTDLTSLHTQALSLRPQLEAASWGIARTVAQIPGGLFARNKIPMNAELLGQKTCKPQLQSVLRSVGSRVSLQLCIWNQV